MTICHILIDPFVLRCAVIIFREDGLAREGGCIFCPRHHDNLLPVEFHSQSYFPIPTFLPPSLLTVFLLSLSTPPIPFTFLVLFFLAKYLSLSLWLFLFSSSSFLDALASLRSHWWSEFWHFSDLRITSESIKNIVSDCFNSVNRQCKHFQHFNISTFQHCQHRQYWQRCNTVFEIPKYF